MVMNRPGWQGSLGSGSTDPRLPPDVSAEVRQQIQAEAQRQPLVEITVRLYGSGNGQSQIGVKPADASVLVGTELAGLGGSGQARAAAYARLIAVLQRELQAGLSRLGAG